MQLHKLADKLTPEMLDAAIELGTRGSLLLAIARCTAMSKQFTIATNACVKGAAEVPLGTSETVDHKLARTALIGGIQIGIVLASFVLQQQRPD